MTDAEWIECRVDPEKERAAVLEYAASIGITRQGDEVHFDVTTFLKANDWPDTPENREICVEAMREAAAGLLPGVPVVER